MARTGLRQIRRRQRMERGINSSKAGRFAADVLQELQQNATQPEPSIVYDDIAIDGPVSRSDGSPGLGEASENYLRYEAEMDIRQGIWDAEEES